MRKVLSIGAVMFLFTVFSCSSSANKERVTFVENASKINVLIDGKIFTSYDMSHNLTKPICYPVNSPLGIKVNRSYPFADVKGESHDHPHHTGIFFTYDKVNGNGFWNNTNYPPQVQHVSVQTMQEGDQGVLQTVSEWVAKNEKVLLREDREMIFTPVGKAWVIDFTLKLTAVEDEVTFDPTKEGMFAIRVAHWLKEKDNTGEYLSSTGAVGAGDCWGRRAKWLALQGEYEGKLVGIAIMNHPGSYNFPTFWHARDYGLFAANPLGQEVFQKSTNQQVEPLKLTLQAGNSAVFKFRVAVYDDKMDGDELEALYAQYTEEKL